MGHKLFRENLRFSMDSSIVAVIPIDAAVRHYAAPVSAECLP